MQTNKDTITSVAQDAKQGIPHVEGRKSKTPGKPLVAAAMLALCVLVGYNLYQNQDVKEQKTETSKAKENGNIYTSNKTLVLDHQAAVKKEEIKNQSAPEPAISPNTPAIPPVAYEPALPTYSAPLPAVAENDREKPKEPTLTERRNSAPMMGEANTIQAAPENSTEPVFRASEPPRSSEKFDNLLTPIETASVRASMMPNRNLLLSKGTFIECILETKVDTTVPGMTSCVIPRNIYSANGKTLLLERGSKAVGEYKGAVENGLNRIFVLWTQIQTPNGVRINLNSPSTDALGGAGLSGEIDFHWWRRFGNALLFTLIQDGFDFGMSKNTENNGGVNYYQNSQDGMERIIEEAMRQSGNIPPTLTKNQGERIGILVARDVDFSSVYSLKPLPETTK